LPNVLGKQSARDAGAYEAWMVDRDGYVTEGTSSNAWILSRDGHIVTRSIDEAILNGVTRIAVIELARRHGLRFREGAFTVAEAKAAREAFLTSTTSLILAVTRIDGKVIGNGKAGSFTRKLRQIYLEHIDGAESRR
jgi:D-alanine transaminase